MSEFHARSICCQFMHKIYIWRLVKIEGEVSPHLVLASGVLLREGMKSHFFIWLLFIHQQLNLLKTIHNLLSIRNQSIPRCKHFPPRL